MEIGIIFSGEFGRRFVTNLVAPWMCSTFGACGVDGCDYCKRYDLSSMVGTIIEVPESSALGTFVENVGEYIEPFSCDALFAVNLHPDLLAELPEIAEFKALIVPACDQRWCMPGLRKQLAGRCEEAGIEFASPKPFCTLEPSGRFISRVCRKLGIGKPEFRVRVENIDGRVRINTADVVTSDPCGSAYFVARRMRGYEIEEKTEFWKEIHQLQCAYPCMASMERDPELVEAPFHLAGYIMVYRFSKACGIDAEGFVPQHFRRYL